MSLFAASEDRVRPYSGGGRADQPESPPPTPPRDSAAGTTADLTVLRMDSCSSQTFVLRMDSDSSAVSELAAELKAQADDFTEAEMSGKLKARHNVASVCIVSEAVQNGTMKAGASGEDGLQRNSTKKTRGVDVFKRLAVNNSGGEPERRLRRLSEAARNTVENRFTF